VELVLTAKSIFLGDTMKNQLVSFIHWLFAVVLSLLNNPRRVRLIVTVIILILALGALLIPSLPIFAGGMGGGGTN
jgi:hypothetical protein